MLPAISTKLVFSENLLIHQSNINAHDLSFNFPFCHYRTKFQSQRIELMICRGLRLAYIEWEIMSVIDDVWMQRTCLTSPDYFVCGDQRIRHDFSAPPGYVTPHSAKPFLYKHGIFPSHALSPTEPPDPSQTPSPSPFPSETNSPIPLSPSSIPLRWS